MHVLSGTDDVPEQTRGGAVDPQCLGMPLTEPDRNANSDKQGFYGISEQRYVAAGHSTA